MNTQYGQILLIFLAVILFFLIAVCVMLILKTKRKQEILSEFQSKQREETQQLKSAHEQFKLAQVKRMQEEKIASISQLAAGIAHEINNPIGFISGNFQFIEECLCGYLKLIDLFDKLRIAVGENDRERIPLLVQDIDQIKKEINFDFLREDMQRLLDESKSGIERVRHIVMNLRTFSSSDQEEASRLSLEETIEKMMILTKFVIKDCISIQREYDHSILIQGQQRLLGQVFMNLIINAAQAIKGKGLILIQSYKDNSHACVEISDTGVGIPQSQIGKIFEPFFTTKPVGQGIGLGLNICHDIVKNHRGEMRVDSRQGLGSIFTVRLPLSPV